MRSCFVLALLAVSYLYGAEDPLAIPNNRTIQLDRIQNLDQKLNSLEQKVNTQRAELKLLKDSIPGDFNTDARLILRSTSEIGNAYSFQDAGYFVDNEEVAFLVEEDAKKPILFDGFLKEGKHTVRIEKRYSANNKIFTYMNNKQFDAVGTIEVDVKPGNATYLDVVSYETNQEKKPIDLKYDTKLVPHSDSGRTILPVSDIPHLLPASPVTETSLVIYSSRELEPGFKLLDQELVLDGKRLKNPKVTVEAKQGLVLFEGSVPPGNHTLEATLRFEGTGRPAMAIKFKSLVAVQPGFKTSVILTNNKKVRVDQEAL